MREDHPAPHAQGVYQGRGEGRHNALPYAALSLNEQNWNPKRIQSLLGHACINMTVDVCGHLFNNAEEYDAMFEKLESELLAA